MTDAIYPEQPYDNGRALITQIGAFWENVFTDNAKLAHMFQGYMLQAAQSYQMFLEYLACSSRLDVPVFARDNWRYIILRESEVTTNLLRYGDGARYGDGYRFGIRAISSEYSVLPPENFKSAEFAFNRIIDPSVTLTSGVDFKFDGTFLVFADNPFDNEFIPKRNVIGADGEVIDREAALWFYNAEFDLEYIWQQWGYAMGVFMESSTYYRDFINALCDSYIFGPTLSSIQGLLQAMTGIPLVREPQETVEVIIEGADKTTIVTDKHAYTFVPGVTVIVAEGEVVYGGEALTDSLQVVEVFNNTPPDTVFPALACGRNFLVGAYTGELTFKNEDTPLEYLGIDDNGKAIVQFEVSGYAQDIQNFWDQVNARGLLSGKTFAEYLDTRENPTTQPIPQFLPDTINPLDFVLQNFMGNNLCYIRMKVNDFAAGAPGLDWFKALRRCMTPHTTCIVYVELSPEDEYIDLGENGFEDIELFDANDVEDELDDSSVFEAILLMEVLDCEEPV